MPKVGLNLEDQIQADRRQIENYKDQIDQLHRLLEKQRTLLEHEQQLRLTEIKPATKQIDGQPKKKHWWSLKTYRLFCNIESHIL